MILLAIDPGTHKVGFAVFTGAPKKLKLSCCWVATYPKEWSKAVRLGELGRNVAQAIKTYKPDAYAIEAGYVGPNPRTSLVIAEARGAILATIPTGAKVVEIEPSEAKLVATGKGNATKELVQRMVAAQLGIREIPAPDAADACAIGLAAGFALTTAVDHGIFTKGWVAVLPVDAGGEKEE